MDYPVLVVQASKGHLIAARNGVKKLNIIGSRHFGLHFERHFLAYIRGKYDIRIGKAIH